MALTHLEVLSNLRKQLVILADMCIEYDNDKDYFTLELAHKLRVILHNTSLSHGIINQLQWENENFVSTCKDRTIYKMEIVDLASGVKETVQPIFYLAAPIENYKNQFFAYFSPLDCDINIKVIPFAEWWNSEIISAHNNIFSLTRKDLVMAFANKLGGSHLDPNPNQLLKDIDDVDSGIMGVVMFSGGRDIETHKTVAHVQSPFGASIRQIAHELFLSLNAVQSDVLNTNDIYFNKIKSYGYLGHTRYNWFKIGGKTKEFLKKLGDGVIIPIKIHINGAVVGLSININGIHNVESNYWELKFFILVDANNEIHAFESGEIRHSGVKFEAGDDLGFVIISVSGNLKVAYLHKKTVFYTSEHSPNLPLCAVITSASRGATFEPPVFDQIAIERVTW